MKILLALLVSCGALVASEFPLDTANRIANSIWLAEGGHKASTPYGVRNVRDPIKARRIVLNIIQEEWRAYELRLEAGWESRSFIEALGSRYCPPHVCELNRNWVSNVTFHFRKLKP